MITDLLGDLLAKFDDGGISFPTQKKLTMVSSGGAAVSSIFGVPSSGCDVVHTCTPPLHQQRMFAPNFGLVTCGDEDSKIPKVTKEDSTRAQTTKRKKCCVGRQVKCCVGRG